MGSLKNLGDLVDRTADLAKLALVDLSRPKNPRRYTHDDLDRAAMSVSRGLVNRGFVRGDRIAIIAANSAEFLYTYLGIMRAGMVAIPINYKLPRETINFILADGECKLVFADRDRVGQVSEEHEVLIFDNEDKNNFKEFLDPGFFQTLSPGPDEVAMFLYTSGSTGRPKGVPLTHRGHLWVVEMRISQRPDEDHKMLVAAPLYHMNGLAICKVAVAAHLSIILLPQFQAENYINAIEEYGVTWLTSVAAMMAMVVREKDLLQKTDLSSVRIVRMGSAPVSEKLIQDIRYFLPNAQITNGYGTTEAGPVVFGPHPKGLRQPDVSVGFPLPNISRLVDGDNLDADYGELQCKNPAVMPGYNKLPQKTADSFTQDGWYKTGDIMKRDQNGFHYFVGRVDDMFNCGGENIYPSEVEKMLERHAEIEQACVVPVSDDIKGFKPVAFVVTVQDSNVTEESIKTYALENGPAYQHPRRVSFLNSLPLTGTNKIDRKELTQLAENANQDLD
ncbi:MAG: acetyl-CoA synthetase [Rhodospirillaceae bacterium]|nr:acetyl-CoA synthetase [Rhodospirillaceae bacterium]|tara:strand:- start:618 stop:2129 length:1512 start_codon:yes stop_codon:yes gene_type:complete